MLETDVVLENPLELRLGYQMRRASMRMMAALAERLAALDLTVAEASILALVEANPGITQTEIGRMLAIQRANMVPLAAHLTAHRLIARKPADGRSHALHLTPAGRALARKVRASMMENEAHFFGDLAPDEQSRLMAKLQAIRMLRASVSA